MVSYHRATADKELYEILQLQKSNLPDQLSSSEKEIEGFVTVHHTFDILKKMNSICAHCIAKVDNKVVGYALCMDKQLKNEIEILKPMFEKIEMALTNQPKEFSNYISMGQICIDKKHRKKGVFRGLYQFMKQELKSDFEYIITGVNVKNLRSSNAHKFVGFELLNIYKSNNQFWELIILKT